MSGDDATFPVGDYCTRVGLIAADLGAEAPVELVHAVAGAQHRAIPFENLDIHRGDCVGVEPERLVARLIGARRGGICYQLNGLLALALEALGVPVQLWGARVDAGSGAGPGRALGHMAAVVRDGPQSWRLVDVGFGGEFVWRRVDPADPESLRIPVGTASYLLDPRDRPLSAFADMARWHSSSPQSRFTGSVICTLPTAQGRTTLTGRPGAGGTLDYRLIRLRDGVRTEEPVTAAAATELLAGDFGMPGAVAPAVSRVVDHENRQSAGNGSPR